MKLRICAIWAKLPSIRFLLARILGYPQGAPLQVNCLGGYPRAEELVILITSARCEVGRCNYLFN